MAGDLQSRDAVRIGLLLAAGVLLTVDATPPSRDWPVRVGVYAESDTTVRVTWFSRDDIHWFGCDEPQNPPYDSFELWFRPVGETSWTSLGRTYDTFALHDPHGRTGDYSIRGWRGADEDWGVDPAGTTVLWHLANIEVHELNTGDTSWYSFTHYFSTNSVDLYVTDFKPGTVGPRLWLASADVMPDDPGGRSLGGDNLRRTQFSGTLPETTTIVPRWDSLGWPKAVQIDETPLVVACRTQSGNYALVKVTYSSALAGKMRFDTWYQWVPGLRLVAH